MPDCQAHEVAEELMSLQNRLERSYCVIFDYLRNKDNHLLALGAYMKGTRSYISSVPFRWISSRVGYASGLPLFSSAFDYETQKREHISSRDITDVEIMNSLQQRTPDWSRQLAMTAYLVTRETPKFPPILVAGYQPWVYQENSEKWGEEKRALEDSINAWPLDSKNSYFDIDTSYTYFYALDGQHRLMAITGLHKLIYDGEIPLRTSDGEIKEDTVTLEEVIEEVKKIEKERDNEKTMNKTTIRDAITALMDNTIGIELIPAVMAWETIEQARRRMRRTFVDVNQTAKEPYIM